MPRTRTLVFVFALSGLALVLSGQSLRFGVIGDSGAGNAGQQRVAARMAEWEAGHPWEFVLMLGDNIYEDGNPAAFDARFKTPYKALFARGVKFHATLGNHDTRHRDALLGCAQVEDKAFGYVDGRDEYTFEAGPVIAGKRLVRFLSLNSPAWEAEYAGHQTDRTACRGTNQGRLEQLESWLAESQNYHWNILFQHHPLYSYVYVPGIFLGHGSSKGLRALLEPRLQGRVDLVFAGHDHFYERIKPQHGIQYFVSGGGSKLRFGGNFGNDQVAYGAKRRHFLDIQLSRDELRYKAIAEDGAVFDSGTIIRQKR